MSQQKIKVIVFSALGEWEHEPEIIKKELNVSIDETIKSIIKCSGINKHFDWFSIDGEAYNPQCVNMRLSEFPVECCEDAICYITLHQKIG